MNPEEAFNQLKNEFPFNDYLNCNTLDNSYKTVTSVVLKNLPNQAKILDFGCGPCDKTAILQKLGYNCHGFDDLEDDWHKINNNREIILDFINKQGINFIDAKSNNWPIKETSFDMIMLHDVLEHLHDSPRTLLNELLLNLKEEGLLFITVPNAGNIRKRIHLLMGKTNLPPFEGYYWSPDPWRDHIREYVLDDLKKIVDYLELEVVEIKAVDHMLTPEKIPKYLIPFWKAITILFPGWKDSWSLLAKKPIGWEQNKDPKEIEGYTFYPNIKR